MSGAVIPDEVEIPVDVFQQLIQPLLTLVEGGFHGGQAEGVVAVDIHVHPGFVIQFLHPHIGEDGGGSLKACQIEGFGTGNAADYFAGNLLRQAGSGDMGFAVEHLIRVDLVRNQQHAVFTAQIGHAGQLLAGPYDTQRIVRAAQQEHAHLRQLGFKVFPVHGPFAVLFHQLVFHHSAVPGFGHIVKLTINRGLDQHFTAFRGEQLYQHAQCGHNAQAPAYQTAIDGPAMAALLPVADGFKVAGRAAGVTPDAFLCTGG